MLVCLIKNKMFIQTGPRCLINKCPVITGHYNLYSTIYGIVVFMCRIRNNLTQLYAKDITPDDKQELDEALQREVHA
jgi:hypothetical protein